MFTLTEMTVTSDEDLAALVYGRHSAEAEVARRHARTLLNLAGIHADLAERASHEVDQADGNEAFSETLAECRHWEAESARARVMVEAHHRFEVAYGRQARRIQLALDPFPFPPF